ncbi:MAG: formate-dependent phosphoribosylglycinamide formyltransferase [Crocinitomicaceae bacterium]|nr:formate-dependent phosphoribosylglycinamide formyltransferase [Crocinitomicaceae bacterium]MDG1734833.1 formate-dependent phosphoribosylglycinamide formyltransferase [Crocinitomicaceae bacterium]
MKKILLLGSGELGKEFVIACQRLGQFIIAVDSYPNAPAMQVAHESEVISMLDGAALDRIVAKHQPDFIVPEIEAIRTERFYDYEKQGIKVIPSAKAANFTMNRKAIRDLAAIDLAVRTATYSYATNSEELREGVNKCGMPCVVKPLMSSSGKGQSVIRTEADIEKAWTYACEGSRGDLQEVIVEGFIDFDYEITLLTVTQNDGPTLFCPPIGHRQERGDYQESWQPMPMNPEHLKEAQDMAAKVTAELGGAGIWGVEFFITAEGAYFSELSPRPHDTGMVTLGKTQNLNEFELHARAILSLPIPEIKLLQNGASAVVLAEEESSTTPVFNGLEDAMNTLNSEVRLFGKPATRPYRRMGVTLKYGTNDVKELVEQAQEMAAKINVK